MKRVMRIMAAVFAMSATAQATTVYVESNQADQNSLLQFDFSADGNLTPKAQIATSGKGVVDPTFALGPFDSDQEIIVNPENTLLFAVNSGSNSIAVFNILPDGSLKPVQGSPFASNGSDPVSLGLDGNLLTVVNKHNDPAQQSDASLPNYTEFLVKRSGQLLPISDSTVAVANGSSPSQALISPFGSFVFGADFLGGLIQSFKVLPNGFLKHESSLGLPASAFANTQTPRLPLGMAANPNLPLVYVGLPTANEIAVYAYDRQGELHFKNVIADSGNVVCWLRTNAEGTLLYASNTADPSITIYDIATDPLSPKELQKTVLNSKGGAYQLALTPDENNLLVLTQRFQASTPQGQGNEVHHLSLDPNTGLVNQPEAAPFVLDLPGDTRPQGIVVF